MKNLFVLILLCLFLPLGLAQEGASPDQAAKNSPPKKERSDHHEGVWKPVGAILDGARLPAPALKAITLRIAGDRYEITVEGENKVDKGTWTMDASATPKRMVIKGTEGPNQGKTFYAIYEMKNERSLRVCYDLTGTDYPKEFKAPKGSQHYLVGYRRQKE